MWIASIVALVVGFVLGAIPTWFFAPEVGGEFWPYIRVGVTIVGGIIGSKILGIIVGLGFQLFIMNSFSEDF